jgi:PPOX class probable F420-dependent enzyme
MQVAAPAGTFPAQIETVESFGVLADASAILLTAFKKDGTPVPTPLWHAVQDGVVYTSSLAGAGKLKRIRNDPRVTISACTLFGKPVGPTYAARARILSGNESDRASKLKEARYRLARPFHFFEKLIRREQLIGIAIEPSPTVDLPG